MSLHAPQTMARHMETEGMCDMEEVEGGVVRKSRRVSWVREELTVFSWVREKLTVLVG